MLLKRAATRRANLEKSRAAAVVKIRGETLGVYASLQADIEKLNWHYEPTANERVSPNVRKMRTILEKIGGNAGKIRSISSLRAMRSIMQTAYRKKPLMIFPIYIV